MIALKSSRPTYDELFSLSDTNNFNYQVEKLENKPLELDNEKEIELNLLHFETATQSDELQPGTRETTAVGDIGDEKFDSFNSYNEIDEDSYNQDYLAINSRGGLENDWSYWMESSTAQYDPENNTVWKTLPYNLESPGITDAAVIEESKGIDDLVTTKPDVNQPIIKGASDDGDLVNKTKRNNPLKASGLQFFEFPKAYQETPRDYEMKSARYFHNVIDNQISETNMNKVKIHESPKNSEARDDIGSELSVTINITEVTAPPKIRRQISRQGYSPPPSSAPEASLPTSAPEASLPTSCFTSTGCTATCGPGFELLLPNTGTEGCQTGALQVLPCDLGACPERCVWGGWSGWSECERSPGQQDCTQGRQRRVEREETNGGRTCSGDTRETRFCVSSTCLGNLNLKLSCVISPLQVTPESRVSQVLTAMRAEWELRVLLARRASREGLGWPDLMVSMGRELRTECRDLRDLQDTQEQMGRTDCRGVKEK